MWSCLLMGCLPIPVPIGVTNDQPEAFRPAPLKPPESSELLACVEGSMVKKRPDIRIADARALYGAIALTPEGGLSIDSLVNDVGARAELARQKIDFVVSVQREVEDLGKWEAGSMTAVYGMPHGPDAGFDRVDHHLLAVVRTTAAEHREELGTTAHHRKGIFGGPFLPGPWFVVIPVGDPGSRACKALGKSLAEALPEADPDGSVSLALFEAAWPSGSAPPVGFVGQ